MRLRQSRYAVQVICLLAALVFQSAALATPASVFHRGEQAYKAYYATLSSLHWNHVLATPNLTPDGIERGLRITRQVNQALDTYAQQVQQSIRAILHTHTDNADINAVTTAMVSFAKNDVAHERRKVAAVKTALTSLRDHRGEWHITGDSLVFNNPNGTLAHVVYGAFQSVQGSIAASAQAMHHLKATLEAHKGTAMKLYLSD